MSVQDLPPELDEFTAEPEDLTVRRLVRAIDYAEGFWLGFAKSNTPAQRRRLSALCKDLLEPLKIRVLEIELNEPVTDLLPVLRERLAQETAATDEAHETTRPKLAIFVHGLERSIPSREAYPPLLSSLNLKRELFRHEVPHPLLLWLPDYALTALARKAPDFWAWRSSLYEFAPERDKAEQSLDIVLGAASYITESLPEQAKRERLVMLKGLLDDYCELGNGEHEKWAKMHILNEIGLMHETFEEWDEAREVYEQTLTISHDLQDSQARATALHTLGRAAQGQGKFDEAQRLYSESLEIAKQLNAQRTTACALGQLGNLAFVKGDIIEARRFYNECLKIARMLADNIGIANATHNLAMIAQEQGEVDEARRLYHESLEIKRSIGDQHGVSSALHQLAMLSQKQGATEEARRLYNESHDIAKMLGDQRGLAITLHQLGTLAADEGDKIEAGRLFREALSILERLDSRRAEIARQNLARLESNESVSS